MFVGQGHRGTIKTKVMAETAGCTVWAILRECAGSISARAKRSETPLRSKALQFVRKDDETAVRLRLGILPKVKQFWNTAHYTSIYIYMHVYSYTYIRVYVRRDIHILYIKKLSSFQNLPHRIRYRFCLA